VIRGQAYVAQASPPATRGRLGNVRRFLVLIAATFLAACSSGSTAAPAGPTQVPGLTSPASTSPSIPPSPAFASPAGSPTTLTYSGSTDKKTKAFTAAVTLRIAFEVKSQSNFIVDLDQPDGTTEASVANLIGSAKVTTWVYGASGPVYLNVTAGGPWTISVLEGAQSTSLAIPTRLSGSTDVTTVPVSFIGGETVAWTYKGDGNFIVDLISPTDGTTVDNLVNTVGPGADNTVPYDTGDLALDVTASGAWTVSITP
jgi:hypothetical protein